MILALVANVAAADLPAVAGVLGVDEGLLRQAQAALEDVYAGRFQEVPRSVATLRATWPDSAAAPLAEVVLYQSRMFENFDFRYDAPYERAFQEGVDVLDRARRAPGAEGWEALVSAALYGIDGIHAFRKDEYVRALGRALQAVDHVAEARARAPDLADLALGDGIYLYWRTVAADSSAAIPAFADRQEEGLALLRHAEAEAVLVGPPATLALAYSYLEDHRYREAAARCEAARRAWPDNVINLLTLGRVYLTMGRLTEALALLAEVRTRFPDNEWVYLLEGVTLSRAGRHADAAQRLERYVAFPHAPADARGQAWYRLGEARVRLGDVSGAQAAWTAGAGLGNDLARRALHRSRR